MKDKKNLTASGFDWFGSMLQKKEKVFHFNSFVSIFYEMKWNRLFWKVYYLSPRVNEKSTIAPIDKIITYLLTALSSIPEKNVNQQNYSFFRRLKQIIVWTNIRQNILWELDNCSMRKWEKVELTKHSLTWRRFFHSNVC